MPMKTDAPIISSGRSLTGQQVLNELLPIDGTGSGLDADMVDGLHGAQFMQAYKGYPYERLGGIGRFHLWGTFNPGDTTIVAAAWNMAPGWTAPGAGNDYRPAAPGSPSVVIRASMILNLSHLKGKGLSTITVPATNPVAEPVDGLPNHYTYDVVSDGAAGSIYPRCSFVVTNPTAAPIVVLPAGGIQKRSYSHILLYERVTQTW